MVGEKIVQQRDARVGRRVEHGHDHADHEVVAARGALRAEPPRVERRVLGHAVADGPLVEDFLVRAHQPHVGFRFDPFPVTWNGKSNARE